MSEPVALLWVPAALLAGLLQAWRTAMQQRLRAHLTVNGAGLVRYLYALPVVLVVLGASLSIGGRPIPALSPAFFGTAAIAAVAQLLATNLLIMAFGYRNFVVGTAFSKTETVQAAIFGWLLLDERVTGRVVVAIALGVVGVLTLAIGGQRMHPREAARSLVQPAALCGLASGALFAITAVFIRRAALQVPGADPLLSALVTLVVVLTIQTALLVAVVMAREPQTLANVISSWRQSGRVGLLAASGSICLFGALTIAPVALVRVVAQIEVVFTVAFSAFYLRERIALVEVAGLLLVVGGVILVLSGVAVR